MALIPQDSKHQKALVAGILAAAALYAFHSFWYTPQREEVTAMQERVETLESQNRAAQITAARGGGDLEERLAAYERHVMVLEELIPASEEVPALLREITAQARTAGVEASQFRPDPDEPGPFYTRKSYQMGAIGEYHDVARYLTAIASLSRIITPVDVDIQVFNDPQDVMDFDSTPVQVTFRIETYVLPETPVGPPPAQVGGD